MDKNNFKNVTIQVIEQLEGGYYHPDMLADGRVKDSRYVNSGETMFGIDRKAGGNLNTTEAGKKFWSLIDSVNARKSWKWNFKGGELAPKLKELTAEIMRPHYESLAKKYLSKESQKLIENDNRLLFHFIYSSWNGAGWFKKFAEKFNKAVADGERNTDKLVNVAIESRVNSGNSLIKQGGEKISKFFGSGTLPKKTSRKKIIIIVAVAVAVLVLGGFLVYKYKPSLFAGFTKVFKK